MRAYLAAAVSSASLPKLAFLSNVPAPYQVKFCYALARYFDTRFWFYAEATDKTAAFWKMDLGPRCAVIPGVVGARSGRYTTRRHLAWLEAFNPDIVMLGGFSIPANYLAYRWAKRRKKKVVVLTELSRDAAHQPRTVGPVWRILRKMYAGVDAVFTVTPEATRQFRDDFGFGDRVVQARYASDLDGFFVHPVRRARPHLTLLFANRLTPAYNPLEAIHIFAEARKALSGLRLHMAAHGELRPACEKLVRSLDIEESVRFLDGITSWDALPAEYRRADVLIFPALAAAGNFTIWEAMASGMGVIVSEGVLGNGAAVGNGINGFRLPLDRAAWVDAIHQYATQPGLLESHGARGKERVRDLGMDGTAALFHQLISALL